MNLALMLVLSALAAARIHRLFTLDDAGLPIRNAFDSMVERIKPPKVRHSHIQTLRRKHATTTEWRRYKLAKWLDEGFYCPYCFPTWYVLAFVATGLAWSDTWPWQIIAGTLAAAYVASHVSSRIDVPEGEA